MMARMFRAPRPLRLLAAIILGSFLLGFLTNGLLPDLRALALSGVAFATPVLVSALVTVPLAEAFGGKMYLRRSALLGILGMGTLLIASLAALLFPELTVRFLIVGWASTLWLRQAAILATSHSSPLRSFPAVINQPVIGILALLPFFSFGAGEWTLVLVASAAFYGTGLLFAEVAVRPLERASGVDGLSMMRYSLDHMTEKGQEGREEMEAFFDSFANPVAVPLGVLSLRGNEGAGALLVVPSVHPGPYGHLGGSDLPEKFREALEDLGLEVFVPHGPSTHDQNPTTSSECGRLAAWVRAALGEVDYGPQASPFVRASRGAMTVSCQLFNGNALVVASRAPQPTDDIDFATGWAARSAAEEAGANAAILVDAHNCIELGSGAITFGSADSMDVVAATREAVRTAMEGVTDGLRIGCGTNRDLVNADGGLGPQGIQALVVEVANQRTTYLLFDGNNMVPGLRETLLAGIADLTDVAEVLTSDNHIVNNTLPGFNPVGWRMEHDALTAAARTAVERAIAALEPATAGGQTGLVEEVRVWGHQTAVRLTTAIHSSLATMRINAALTFSLATAIALLGLTLVP